MDHAPASLSVSQRLALQVIRRSLPDEIGGGALDERWWETGLRLRLAHQQMVRHQSVGLRTGLDGSTAITRHEKRLLRAAAAAQADDPALVDNLIYVMAPGRRIRPFLTEAVTTLAAGLDGAGHRLPLATIPSAALAVARWHHADLGRLAVIWPDAAVPSEWRH